MRSNFHDENDEDHNKKTKSRMHIENKNKKLNDYPLTKLVLLGACKDFVLPKMNLMFQSSSQASFHKRTALVI